MLREDPEVPDPNMLIMRNGEEVLMCSRGVQAMPPHMVK